MAIGWNASSRGGRCLPLPNPLKGDSVRRALDDKSLPQWSSIRGPLLQTCPQRSPPGVSLTTSGPDEQWRRERKRVSASMVVHVASSRAISGRCSAWASHRAIPTRPSLAEDAPRLARASKSLHQATRGRGSSSRLPAVQGALAQSSPGQRSRNRWEPPGGLRFWCRWPLTRQVSST